MKIFKASRFGGIDGDAVLIEARRQIARHVNLPACRAFLQRSLTLDSLLSLTGRSISDSEQVEAAFSRISCFNDKVQGLTFDLNQLAPTYPDSMITRPFPFNAYCGKNGVRRVDEQAWWFKVTGLAFDRHQWNLANLRAIQQYDQVVRHICMEGWSVIGKWGGARSGSFLRRAGTNLNARYVGLRCANDYHTNIDMATTLHPQTFVAITCDGAPLPPRYGFPMKLRMPTKLGHENPKHIQVTFVTNTYPGGYWEDQGHNWSDGS